MYSLLFVDDDISMNKANHIYFSGLGYDVYTAVSSNAAYKLLESKNFDCIILDILFPEENGFHICKKMKVKTSAPIIFLTNLSDEKSMVNSFNYGGDDYVAKPFSLKELELRITARIRQSKNVDKTTASLTFKNFSINLDARQLVINHKLITLSVIEYELLVFLAKNCNVVKSQTEIYDNVWKQIDLGDLHTVQVHIGRLRKKLNAASPKHSFIQTVWGVGYKFVPIP